MSSQRFSSLFRLINCHQIPHYHPSLLTTTGRSNLCALMTRAEAKRNPPVAKKVRREMKMFGDVRVDDYYWLRDDSRTNPDVISYLKEENDYAKHIMSGTYLFDSLIFFFFTLIGIDLIMLNFKLLVFFVCVCVLENVASFDMKL